MGFKIKLDENGIILKFDFKVDLYLVLDDVGTVIRSKHRVNIT